MALSFCSGALFMKMLSDFLALILFFVVYGIAYFLGYPAEAIFFATGVAVAISVFQIVSAKIRKQKLDMIQKINYSVIVVFGLIGIIFRNQMFLYWKPTIIAWAMALALIISQLMGKNGIKLLLKKDISLPENIWSRLVYIWVAYFVVLGIVNLLVIFNFGEKIWLIYKTFGSITLTVIFVIALGVYLNKHILDKDTEMEKE